MLRPGSYGTRSREYMAFATASCLHTEPCETEQLQDPCFETGAKPNGELAPMTLCFALRQVLHVCFTDANDVCFSPFTHVTRYAIGIKSVT